MHSATFLSARRATMKGVTLIELMISMTLGLVTLGAIGWIYLGTSQAYRTQDAVARLQEGARYAFEVISNDLRMAGALGCSHTTSVNVIPSYQTTWYANVIELPLFAAEQNGSGVTTLSDALRILHADVSREYIVTGHDGTGTFTLAAHDIAPNALLVATDCDHVAVFQASSASTPTVGHAVNLGTAGNVKTYTPGSRIYRLSASTYYVANNPAGVPSLYRAGPTGAEELVEGVQDLQVTFGLDTDADGQVNATDPDAPYLTSAQVATATVTGATTLEERWAHVVSVRISLLMQTAENNVVPEAQTYTYNGSAVTATDRRLHKVFTHVVKMRNR